MFRAPCWCPQVTTVGGARFLLHKAPSLVGLRSTTEHCTGVTDPGLGEWGGQRELHGDQKDEVGVFHFHVRDSTGGGGKHTDSENLREAKTCRRGGGRVAGRGARSTLWRGGSRLRLPSMFSSQSRLLPEVQRPQEWATSPCAPTAHYSCQVLCQPSSQTSPTWGPSARLAQASSFSRHSPLDAGPPALCGPKTRLLFLHLSGFSPSSHPPHSASAPLSSFCSLSPLRARFPPAPLPTTPYPLDLVQAPCLQLPAL